MWLWKYLYAFPLLDHGEEYEKEHNSRFIQNEDIVPDKLQGHKLKFVVYIVYYAEVLATPHR